MTIDRRLRVVADRLRPTACHATGPTCEQAVVVGDGSLDPPTPDLPPTCPDCLRPWQYLIVELPGVDVADL